MQWKARKGFPVHLHRFPYTSGALDAAADFVTALDVIRAQVEQGFTSDFDNSDSAVYRYDVDHDIDEAAERLAADHLAEQWRAPA